MLHTWVGLLPGWLLYVVFLFGTVAFFQQEISAWMRPELHSGALSPRALAQASVLLARQAGGAEEWHISLPPARGGDALSLSWKRHGKPGRAKLDPVTGHDLLLRETRGGFFLYRFHFDLYAMPVMTARLLVSLAALAMLVAILSGVIAHKKIFADFFMLRLGKGQRSWLDAHNASAVLALPFHLMMTYTGLVALLFTLMPWPIAALFPDRESFYAAAYLPLPDMQPTGRAATMLPLDHLIVLAQKAQGAPIASLTISHPGDAGATVQAWPSADRLDGPTRPLLLSAINGAVLAPATSPATAQKVQAVMVDLHAARFAAPMLRWLYAFSGLAGTVMVGSGLTLWVVKRRARLPDPTRPHAGFHIVERLNIAVIAGAPLGIAAYFLANRLLPIAMQHRADGEIDSLFIAWGAALAWALARPARRAWFEISGACATAYALVPMINAMTTPRGLLPSLIARDTVFVAFDLTMLVAAVLFAFTARRIAKHPATPAIRRKKPRAVA